MDFSGLPNGYFGVACSLRMGEMVGLTWDCVDISEEAIAENRAYIYVNKQLQRISKLLSQSPDMMALLRAMIAKKQ